MESLLRAQTPIDLHMHSTVSDGSDTPAEVVRAAHAQGVRTMALTDHDNISGWAEAEETCLELGMTFVPGVEMSTKGPGTGSMHMLAYLFDPNDPNLMTAVVEARENKYALTKSIVDSLATEYDLTWDDVLEQAAGATPQKPHVGAAMVAKGLVPSTDHYWESVMHHDSRHYRSGPELTLPEAIALVRKAGGVPIIAHPTARNRVKGAMPEDRLVQLLEAGLAGFELDHPQNGDNPFGLERLWEYQAKYDFIVTGSSDYHGTRKTNIPGERSTSPEMLARIISDAAERGGISPTHPPTPDAAAAAN